jgi:peroxiredoxin
MAKLEIGQTMPDFEYVTPFSAGHTLAATAVAAPKTALVFLRYWGCPLCQYDIHLLAQAHKDLTAKGGQLLVVLQSDPKGLAEQLGSETALPFPIVCDPEQKLYKEFCIEPAASMMKMADLKMVGRIVKATKLGFKHGAYEGDEQQLPAAFVVDGERKVLYAHYAKSVSDMPDATQLAQLLA